MGIISKSGLRTFSSIVFASAVTLGPCIGICSGHDLTARTIKQQSSQNKGHCGKHTKTTNSDSKSNNNNKSSECPDCEKNQIICVDSKDLSFNLNTSQDIELYTFDAELYEAVKYTKIELFLQPLTRVVQPTPIYRKNCSILE